MTLRRQLGFFASAAVVILLLLMAMGVVGCRAVHAADAPFTVQGKVTSVLTADGFYWYRVRINTGRAIYDVDAEGGPGLLPGDRVLLRAIRSDPFRRPDFKIIRRSFKGE